MTAGPPTSPSLLARLRHCHDPAAWAEFVDLYAPVVFGFARRRGLQDADAADLTQDVLRSVVGAITRFEYAPARGGFRAWLFHITRNHLRSFLRRAARVARLTAVPAGAEPVTLDELPDDAGPDDVWEAEWRREVYARACDHARKHVEAATWEAFHQTAVLGRTGPDVARALGLTAAAVYLARSRVLARLRRFVESLEAE